MSKLNSEAREETFGTQEDLSEKQDLNEKLDFIQSRLDEIASVLQEQSAVQKARAERRWRPTLRLLLLVMGLLAVGAAWMGSELRQAKMQDAALKVLVGHGARIELTPSESLLAALMPGSPAEPPAILRRTLGREFFNCLSQVSITGGLQGKSDLSEVREALGMARKIRGLRLSGVKLKTSDLEEVFKMSELESLDLKRSQLDQNPIPGIANTSLIWFDGSHTRLGDQAAYDLSFCQELTYLNLDRTTITDQGLEYLKALSNLKQLSVNRTRISLSAVTKFAGERPDCYIQYQPLVFLPNGVQDAAASMRGAKSFGTRGWIQSVGPPGSNWPAYNSKSFRRSSSGGMF